jgi:hypothetical protein
LKPLFETADISTRPKRRRAVSIIVATLGQIQRAETAYLERMPDNLQDSDAHAAAEESIDMLTEAIGFLIEAY